MSNVSWSFAPQQTPFWWKRLDHDNNIRILDVLRK